MKRARRRRFLPTPAKNFYPVLITSAIVLGLVFIAGWAVAP